MIENAHASHFTTHPGGVVRVSGRYRLPSDVGSELRHVLAGSPPLVVLDVVGIAAPSMAMDTVLGPVADYLAEWPGTVLVLVVPDIEEAVSRLPFRLSHHVLVQEASAVDLDRAHEVVPQHARAVTHLPPLPQAVVQARRFTVQTLRGWGLDGSAGPAALVVSELVTHSIRNADTVLDLTLGHVPDRIRIAVHDYGTANDNMTRVVDPADPLEDSVGNRGLRLVRDLTLCWGMFPQQQHQETVWAVMRADPGAAIT